MADLKRVRVEAEVDEFDVGGMALGAAVKISAEGFPQVAWRGRVEEIPDVVVGRRLRPEDPGRPPIRGSFWSKSPYSNRLPSNSASGSKSKSPRPTNDEKLSCRIPETVVPANIARMCAPQRDDHAQHQHEGTRLGHWCLRWCQEVFVRLTGSIRAVRHDFAG